MAAPLAVQRRPHINSIIPTMPPTTSPFICLRCLRTLQRPSIPQSTRTIATTPTQRRRSQSSTSPDSPEHVPRWMQTPARMKMPIRLRPEPRQPAWRVNENQGPVDEMYDRFMGGLGEVVKDQVSSTRGRDLLPEEIKWLALTHKSFDHGRRGFNDRLAFLGKRIVDVQTSLALLRMPPSPSAQPTAGNSEIYQHPALEGLENITHFSKTGTLDKARLASVAASYGINRVVRWKPKKSDNLKGSGEEVVLAHTMYSIIGALALQRGGDLAAKTARERILRPLGLKYI